MRMLSVAILALSCGIAQWPAAAKSLPHAEYLKLPLAFVRQGQGYVARGSGYRISLSNKGAAVALSPGAVTMEFAGGRKTSASAGTPLPGKVNEIHGRDPQQWQLGLTTYSRISYEEVYPGIDVVYYGNQREMEFDLILKPGADPKQVRLRFAGSAAAKVTADGGLSIHTQSGELRLAAPAIYQEDGGVRRSVRGRFVRLGKREVGFRVDAYDRTKRLVIDPVIVYSTLLGGGTESSSGNGIAVDSAGNVYVTGQTSASDFPIVNAAFPQTHRVLEGFVSKIDATGSVLLYSTYIGGSDTEYCCAIAVDPSGAAWITGETESNDFPLLNAYQTTLGASQSAFLAKLNAAGALVYSTYFGSDSKGSGIAVDAAGSAYVAGTEWGSIPTTVGAYLTSLPGGQSGFLAKFLSSGSLAYSTLLGSPYFSAGATGVAVDAIGAAYVTGFSGGGAFPNAPPGGPQATAFGFGDAFILKLNAAGSALVYFTFLGGSAFDVGTAIAVDAAGSAYVTGSTASSDFPVTPSAFQTRLGGAGDAFAAKVNSAGTAFHYVTYLGGNHGETGLGVAVDSGGNAVVTGYTESDNFPLAGAIMGTPPPNVVSLFRTTNFGASWNAFDAGIPGDLASFLPDPVNRNVMVAASDAGISRSVDSGQTWNIQVPGNVFSVSRSLGNSSILYAAACCYKGYRSADGGATWTSMNILPNASRVLADPLDSNTAYAYYEQSSALYKTRDGGVSWLTLSQPAVSIYSMVAGADGALYIDSPSGVFKSGDHGTTWTWASSGIDNSLPLANGLTITATIPTTLYRAGGGRLYKSTNGGASWSALTPPDGLGGVAVLPNNPAVVYISSYFVPQVYRSSDGGSTWSAAGSGLGRRLSARYQMAFGPNDDSVVYLLTGPQQLAFVSKLNPTGSGLVYSTYLPGGQYSRGSAVALNGSGDAHVTGQVQGEFPVTSNVGSNGGYPQAYAVRISGATPPCSYSVSPTSQVIDGSVNTLTYKVLAPSGCAWTASSSQSWIGFPDGASATGTGLVTVQAAANGTGAIRTAQLTIGGQAVTITQAPTSCYFGLSQFGASVGQSGGTLSVSVTAPSGCPWSVTNNYPNALSVLAGGAGNGNGVVTLSVQATTAPTSRMLVVPIGDSRFTITQSGTCNYSVSPSAITMGGGGGTGTISVSAAPGCKWGTYSQASWLTIGTGGTGSGTLSYSAPVNTGVPRSALIFIEGEAVQITQFSGVSYLISTIVAGQQPATATLGSHLNFSRLTGIAADGGGNVYFTEYFTSTLFRMARDGTITRVAGSGVCCLALDGQKALDVRFSNLDAVTVDAAGNLYVADGSRIWKIDTNGITTTVAGTGTPGYSGDGGPATMAAIYAPSALAVDSSGSLYVADTLNHRVRKISAGGFITTVAGTGVRGPLGDGGLAVAAQLDSPSGLAVDPSGRLYISTGDCRVRMVSVSGIITTVAGTGVCGSSGDGGPATLAQIFPPSGLALDAAGNLYVAAESRVRKIGVDGIISAFAGSGQFGYSGDGGPATAATFGYPVGVVVDSSGNAFIADLENQSIRKVTTDGVVNTVAGGGIGDAGPAAFADLRAPHGVVRDAVGNLYISDFDHNRVRKVALDGTISTVAGTGVRGYSGDGGPAARAQLNAPEGLALDSAGNLYIADQSNYRVRKVAANGIITTVAGNGSPGFSGDGGPAAGASLRNSTGVVVGPAGDLYISDTGNHRIRKVAANGTITTVAGNGIAGFSGDGGVATNASLNRPESMAVDPAGNIYFSDSGNNRFRRVTPTGVISTVAGNGAGCCIPPHDGDMATATAIPPGGLAVDSSGDLLITGNSRVLQVSPFGTVTTWAGTGLAGPWGDGGPALQAQLASGAITVEPSGRIYVADMTGSVRLLTPVGAAAVLTVRSSHTGNFTAGQTGAYTVIVTNAATAAPATGSVTVTELLPSWVSFTMTGAGWNCSAGVCARSDALAPGATYPPIAVTVTLPSTALSQLTNQVLVSGGGAAPTGTQDFTTVLTNCSFTVNPESLILTDRGTSYGGFYPSTPQVITVTPNALCAAGIRWTVTASDGTWLRVVGSGSGGGAFQFTALSNTHNASRWGSLTVSAAGASAVTVPVIELAASSALLNRQVTALYQALLGREPDSSGFDFWTGRGTNGLGAMADSFLTSPESVSTGVQTLAIYQALLGRFPTFPEFLANGLRTGGSSPSVLLANLMASPEYLARVGAPDNLPSFVNAVYANLLQRAPTQAELNAAAVSNAYVVFAVVFQGLEYRNLTTPKGADHSNSLYVTLLYLTILGRAPEPGGFNFWMNVVNGGGPGVLFQPDGYATRITILGPGYPGTGFIGSSEFQGHFQP